MPEPVPPTVLHYTGYDDDRGGIMSVVGALAETAAFACVVGVNPGYQSRRFPALRTLACPRVNAERLGVATLWRARTVAAAVQAWLDADPNRVFHGHSRAGLAVALRLAARGERRVVATVHCYGRHRWYYRRAARRLADRLHWLSPAMKRHYGLPVEPGDPWSGCLPGCVPGARADPRIESVGTTLRLAGVGTLTQWKRWDLVLEALARLPEARRGRVGFRHIGGPDGSAESRACAAELQRQTAALGLSAVVEWRGEQPSSAALLAESDALVVASAGEPFSVAMLEALFAGVPVIASDSGGAQDLIVPPVNGRLFRTGDAADLARMIDDLAGAVGRGGVAIDRPALQRFTAATSAAQHVAIYRRLVRTPA
ncbi:MAG: glycosyltransferase [Opitutaceae bacterium]|nr:glycosyltransferase [Opitutaceae bacterium]